MTDIMMTLSKCELEWLINDCAGPLPLTSSFRAHSVSPAHSCGCDVLSPQATAVHAKRQSAHNNNKQQRQQTLSPTDKSSFRA